MSKKILLIIVTLNLLFIPHIRALENNTTVNFSVSFEENIDIDKIDKIFIMMDDAEGQDYEIVLERKNNFNLELDNVGGDVIINSIVINQDYLVEYEFEDNIIYESDTELSVKILVRAAEKNSNKDPVAIDEEALKRIFGNNVNSNSTTTTTTEVIIPSPNDKTTTTEIKEEIDEEKLKEEQQKQDEHQVNQIKRNNIYKIVLVLFLLIIIIFILFAAIKIANANK